MNSGVRSELINKILELINKGVYPYVPEQGSVGSSGDLAPLCHFALVLIGEGECIVGGKRVSSKIVLKEKNITPISLNAKEGLAVSNGTNVQTAILTLAFFDACILAESADMVASLTVEVLMASRTPFHKSISQVRDQKGQIEVANNIWNILKDSKIIDSHKNCDRVQDSYSLRCIPQVHGAIRDNIQHVGKILEIEINSVTDNPLVFSDQEMVLSGGNFHGEPIAFASDILKMVISELGNISERRIAKMIDPSTNDNLPAYLIDNSKGGLHSGLMIPQYVAAALVSENKILCHPASVDSIPTSANQEDHVSMGTIAARNTYLVVKNVRNIIAIELLNNTQAYEFRQKIPLSATTNWLYKEVRNFINAVKEDRPFYLDIEKLSNFIYEENITKKIKASFKNWYSIYNL